MGERRRIDLLALLGRGASRSQGRERERQADEQAAEHAMSPRGCETIIA